MTKGEARVRGGADWGTDLTPCGSRAGLIRSPFAGDEMDRRLLRALTDKNARVRPRYELRRSGPSGKLQYVEFGNTHPSYRDFMRMVRVCCSPGVCVWRPGGGGLTRRRRGQEVVRDAKASLCAVCEDSPSRALPGAVTPATYELPDGTSVTLEKERFEVPEIIFDPGACGVRDRPPPVRAVPRLTPPLMVGATARRRRAAGPHDHPVHLPLRHGAAQGGGALPLS